AAWCLVPVRELTIKSTGLIAFKRGSLYVVLVVATWLSVPSGLIPAGTGAGAARAAAKPNARVNGPDRIKQLESALDRAVKKGEADAQADALYDLAKTYFEAGDLTRAEEYMRNSLAKESGLKRPDSAIRTRV